MGKLAAQSRKEIYSFICDELGVKMTSDQSDTLKKLVVANAHAQSEDLLK